MAKLLPQQLLPLLFLLSSSSYELVESLKIQEAGKVFRYRWTRLFRRYQQPPPLLQRIDARDYLADGFGRCHQHRGGGTPGGCEGRPLFGSLFKFAATARGGGGSEGLGSIDGGSSMSSDFRKLESPSADRNKEPIWTLALEPRVLSPILDGLDSGNCDKGTDQQKQDEPIALRVLEVAAGAGVHTQYFALKILSLIKNRQQPWELRWHPSDPSSSALDSQRAYRDEYRNVLATVVQEPLPLTLSEQGIVESDTREQLMQAGGGTFHVILCINMVHIAPWSATLGLFQVASQFLHRDPNARAALVLYGPFRVNGSMVESNVRFDGWLKSQDSQYGVRNLEDVVEVARQIADLVLDETIEMPANNLCLVFRRRQST